MVVVVVVAVNSIIIGCSFFCIESFCNSLSRVFCVVFMKFIFISLL